MRRHYTAGAIKKELLYGCNKETIEITWFPDKNNIRVKNNSLVKRFVNRVLLKASMGGTQNIFYNLNLVILPKGDYSFDKKEFLDKIFQSLRY